MTVGDRQRWWCVNHDHGELLPEPFKYSARLWRRESGNSVRRWNDPRDNVHLSLDLLNIFFEIVIRISKQIVEAFSTNCLYTDILIEPRLPHVSINDKYLSLHSCRQGGRQVNCSEGLPFTSRGARHHDNSQVRCFALLTNSQRTQAILFGRNRVGFCNGDNGACSLGFL